MEVETEYFYVHGCFALMVIGKSNIEEVCRLARLRQHQSEVSNWCSLREAFAAESRKGPHLQFPAAANVHTLQSVSERCHLPRKAYRHQHRACVWVCRERPGAAKHRKGEKEEQAGRARAAGSAGHRQRSARAVHR
jgi:hypothetical protein